MTSSVKKAFSRLPKCLIPVHYNLRLKPDLEKFTFKGWCQIQLKVTQDTKEVVCNALDLTIESLKVSSEVVPAESIKLCPDAETLSFGLTKPLSAGSEVQMSVNFAGTLNDKMKGFYRSKYTTDGGEDRYIATTQFESTDARRCFPCWDEPAVKATFSVSIIAPKDRSVHSNMDETTDSMATLDELAKDEVTEDHKLVNFNKSPIMSTYLLAFIVGDFASIDSKTKDNILVRSFAPPAKLELGRFALDTSVKALEFYTEYFNVPYPLPKYDCIAIADFACGAMENWGLVTYRESCILVDPKNSSSASKQWVAIVVNHEMAHQWFGNLVTMEWWTHLWLNEGFASFMENYCTDVLYPEFSIWTQFVGDHLITALELDSMENSHPIEVEVGHPDEVDEIFDSISYNKGASVIRMLHNYIGNDAFRKGMNSYLKKHSYKNAQTEDLWRSLEEASQKPVGKIMGTWTSQMGFPMVKVEKAEYADGKTTLTLTQEKFNADGSTIAGPEWKVPITLVTSKGHTQSHLMEGKETKIVVEGTEAEDWIKLNNDFIGYYRVQYEPEYLLRFHKDLESKKLSELNRLSLIDDTMNSVQAGRISADVIMKMILGFKSEDSYTVWKTINSCFGKLNVILYDTECHGDFKKYVGDVMSLIVDTIGWEPKEGESHMQGLLRMLVISRMGQLGHEGTVAEARKRLAAHIAKAQPIPADLRSPVYRVCMANGDEETLDQLIALYHDTDMHEEKDRISRSMGSCRDKKVLEKVLAFAISDAVRSQNSPFVIAAVAANPAGRELAWQFFITKFEFLNERYSSMLLMRLIKCNDGFTTMEKADEIEKFFKEHPVSAERAVKQCVENIRLNAAWLKRDGDKIAAFLKSL